MEKWEEIVDMLGSRRAGKSTYLLQLHRTLELRKRQGICIDFTEYLWQDFGKEDWKRLWEVALEINASFEPVSFWMRYSSWGTLHRDFVICRIIAGQGIKL